MQIITVDTSTSDTDLLKQLSSGSGNFVLQLNLNSDEIFRVRGMVPITGDGVTYEDIGRVLEVAGTSMRSCFAYVQVSPACRYIVDGTVESETMPISMPGKRLEAILTFCILPKERLKFWHALAVAAERNLVAWRVKVDDLA